MNVHESNLPVYDFPPVVETVLGVQFETLENFLIPHFGLYWSLIKSDFPDVEVKHPLPPQIERIGQKFDNQEPIFKSLEEPEARCWFINTDKTKLLQVQQDRFLFNWKKVMGGDSYPRYDNLKINFESEWARFVRFLQEEGINPPKINQCEVSYINHLEQGLGWENFSELENVTSFWTSKENELLLPNPEVVLLNCRYLLPSKMGRLHIQLQPAIRNSDSKEVIQLSLTVRGQPKTSNFQDVLDWLDSAQEWIVRGFTDFTSPRMHEIWGRKVRK